MRLSRATEADCAALAETSRRAFLDDVRFGAPEAGGPPGFDSPAWHRQALTWGDVWALSQDEGMVGGAIVIRRSPTSAELGRVWLVPECQGRGLGAEAMTGIEALYPEVVTWTLETPTWNLRNQSFYPACGFVEVDRAEGQVRYEKRTA